MMTVTYYDAPRRKYTIFFDGTFEVTFASFETIDSVIDYVKNEMERYGFEKALIRETETGNQIAFIEWERDEQ